MVSRSGRGDFASGKSDMATRLARARAKLEEIERELGKHPEFQLHLFAKTQRDRMRIEAIFISVPAFALWHKLRHSVALAPEWPRPLAGPTLADVPVKFPR
jgi:hypothetical protein